MLTMTPLACSYSVPLRITSIRGLTRTESRDIIKSIPNDFAFRRLKFESRMLSGAAKSGENSILNHTSLTDNNYQHFNFKAFYSLFKSLNSAISH